MASETPEDAFGEGNAGWEDDGNDAYNVSATEHSLQSQNPPDSFDPSLQHESSGEASAADNGDAEYDPESVNLTESALPPVSAASTSAPRASKKPKKAGGFIVGSSDDEEDEDDNDIPDPAAPTTNTQSPITRPPTNPTNGAYTAAAAQASSAQAGAANSARLPTDVVGQLEDRIKDDPRGDLEAWLSLIEEQRRRNKLDDARAVYERFLTLFPQSAEIWVAYLEMELSLDNFQQAETIFSRTLLIIPNVQLWTVYLNYIRRRNDLNDPSGQARQVVSQSYEFVLEHIGHDRDSGKIWQDYIQFLKSGPGQAGGSSWQDQQKMDLLRKAYQRAICIPMGNLNTLWKEYDQFELGLNKSTGRKFIQERSPSYMSARSANTHLDNITRGLNRTTLPRLPPAPGFDGDQEYLEQVELWRKWIAWEKDDPLVLKDDEPETYRSRILYVYKQTLMALRFWPEIWVDAAEWCFDNSITGKDGADTGLQFLVDGVAANPESSLLALKHADRIESTHVVGEGEDGKIAFGQAVRIPYDTVLETLYDMIKKLKERETTAITKIQEDPMPQNVIDIVEETDEGEVADRPAREDVKKERIKTVQDGFAVQIQMLSLQISYLWIALARAFRRIQGQGGKGSAGGGVRAIFTEARQRGRLTSDVYAEIAHIEWDIYQDAGVAFKIFDRGSKLFPEDEHFMVAYLKHLHAKRDFTNARVVFSQTVKRLKEKGLIHKLRPLYAYFHTYEAKYGELAQIKELEKQMSELFPDDPSLTHFATRFSTERFNPIAARVIISPKAQMRPKNIFQSVERPSASARSSPYPTAVPQDLKSPRPQFLQAGMNSPKRPFQVDDDEDLNPPRKLARGASPLKGAAGRRLDQQRRAQPSSHSVAPAPIPRDLTFLLTLIPASDDFSRTAPIRYTPSGVVRLIQNTQIPDYKSWDANRSQAARQEPPSRTHTRNASTEYPYGYGGGRDSPGLSNRPISPYGGAQRGAAQTAYRNSPLRPGSSGSYEPPPAAYQQPSATQFNPVHQQPPPSDGYSSWPPGAPPAGYEHNPYAQPPPQQYQRYPPYQ